MCLALGDVYCAVQNKYVALALVDTSANKTLSPQEEALTLKKASCPSKSTRSTEKNTALVQNKAKQYTRIKHHIEYIIYTCVCTHTHTHTHTYTHTHTHAHLTKHTPSHTPSYSDLTYIGHTHLCTHPLTHP